jgi:hypothetical protein
MFFQINGLRISPLDKASNAAVIPVDIIANHLTEDTDRETVLKEAFQPETVKEFLDIGVIEFWHESKNPILTKEEKHKNILGKPTGFRWENGLPVVTAELTKSHPLVQDMLPHLEANQSVYAASIGGSKMVLEVSDDKGGTHRVIPRIKWDHLAIAPANAVINRAPGLNVKLLQKANEIICEFDNYDIFTENINIADNEQELRKALMSPASVSDMQNTPGGVVTKQSLEKKPVSLTFDEDESLMIVDTLMKMRRRQIPSSRKEYGRYAQGIGKRDFGMKFMCLIDKYFKKGANYQQLFGQRT